MIDEVEPLILFVEASPGSGKAVGPVRQERTSVRLASRSQIKHRYASLLQVTRLEPLSKAIIHK